MMHIKDLGPIIRALETETDPKAKLDLMDLAKRCQILPEQDSLLHSVAKAMTPLVKRVFGPLSLIFVMTEPGRRQVFLAVLARMCRDGSVTILDATARTALLEQLLCRSDAQLIAQAYGSCPPGFIAQLKRLGDVARSEDFYLDLFDYLSANPGVSAHLNGMTHDTPLNETTLDLLKCLPPSQSGLRLLRHFQDADSFRHFMGVYEIISGHETLQPEHLERIAKGQSPHRLLENLYLRKPFPPPAIAPSADMHHIPDGAALVRAAKSFRNCLTDYVAEGLRGVRQYYIWHAPDSPPVLFSIDADPPFGWFLSECRLKNNEPLPDALTDAFRARLVALGIRRDCSIEELMKPFRGRNSATLDAILRGARR